MTFKCRYQGLLLPRVSGEEDWPNVLRLFLYLLGLFWIFLGVAVISDVFMAGIEKITSSKRRTTSKETGRTITVYVWNATVSNLTLMALGSSAPEILLSVIEITTGNFFMGPLGAGTIVGSAAFNLLMISAVCVLAIPDGEVRFIKEVPVYVITATCSVFAYLWLMFILMVTSPDVCEIWEGVLTFMFCPILVFLAYLADRGYFGGETREARRDNSEGETIPSDVTDEELVTIQKSIREQHGDNLTPEEVVKIMRAQYFSKRSRAYYRHSAMEAKLHGKKTDLVAMPAPEFAIQECIGTSDEVKKDKEKEKLRTTIRWATEKYAFREGCGKAELTILRCPILAKGAEGCGKAELNLGCKASVRYTTKDNTAKADSDYDHVSEVVTFEEGQKEVKVSIVIRDDTSFEDDESFLVQLTEASCEDSEKYDVCVEEDHDVCEVVIIDDDMPGSLRFKQEEVEVVEGENDEILRVNVDRFNGCTGKISCNYHTDTMGAVEGIDYVASKGVLEFDNAVQTAAIEVVIKAKGRINQTAFNVVIDEPNGCEFDYKTDGGAEKCICHVVIKGKEPEGGDPDLLGSMRERIHSANAVMGHRNWAQQFKDALFQIGEDDDGEEDGDGEENGEHGEKTGPSKFDYFMHIISLPWKLLFAFVPPVDYCGGWACFFGALVMIGFVTAVVGDMANLVGCCMDLLPETAAITFVALGTSLPDTFASKTAAIMDPYADASIGNVTGSNSVNVFLGIGIAWTMAAIRWETSEPDAEWMKRYLATVVSKPDVAKNIADAVESHNGNAVFVAEAGTLWFNLMVFSVNAFCALQHLFARRRKHGGELGGPKKGFFGQYFSGAFLCGQWFIYVTASVIFARSGGKALTYSDIAEQ